MFSSTFITFIAGTLVGASFAPINFLPGIFGLSLLLQKIKHANSIKSAFKQGYVFGIGLFLALLYWIAIGVSVYADKFWWAIPFALFGLPLIMGIFPALASSVTYFTKDNEYFHISFCIVWVFFEWLSSWILTGFPWGLLGYICSFSLTMMQSASIWGVYGLSFIIIYLGSIFYAKTNILIRTISIAVIILLSGIYGYLRLQDNPTKFSDHTIRVVQPSIAQSDKWKAAEFFNNLEKHIELSMLPFNPYPSFINNSAKKPLLENNTSITPDIIVWSEAALTAPYYYSPILKQLLIPLERDDQVLISGGITDNGMQDDKLEIYSSIIALKSSGEVDFEYHKSHLVPFGEYIPFSKYLPIHKITPGLLDYTEGTYETVSLDKQNLNIKPQICYEAIFPDEAAVNAANIDLIINVTNDSWYGKSSGPYQHFQIARMRAIESAVPLVRAANNGISAIIDPVGRILDSTLLNEVTTIDSFIPKKNSDTPSIYFKYGYLCMLAMIFLVIMLQTILTILLKTMTRHSN